MDLQYSTELVVYKIPKGIFLKSIHSSFETEIEYGTNVGYSEEYNVLFVGTEGFEYSVRNYIDDVMKVNSTVKTYAEYVEEYKDRLNKLHSDAPVLNRNSKPSEFDPQNPFQRLLDAGVHIKLS